MRLWAAASPPQPAGRTPAAAPPDRPRRSSDRNQRDEQTPAQSLRGRRTVRRRGFRSDAWRMSVPPGRRLRREVRHLHRRGNGEGAHHLNRRAGQCFATAVRADPLPPPPPPPPLTAKQPALRGRAVHQSAVAAGHRLDGQNDQAWEEEEEAGEKERGRRGGLVQWVQRSPESDCVVPVPTTAERAHRGWDIHEGGCTAVRSCTVLLPTRRGAVPWQLRMGL